MTIFLFLIIDDKMQQHKMPRIIGVKQAFNKVAPVVSNIHRMIWTRLEMSSLYTQRQIAAISTQWAESAECRNIRFNNTGFKVIIKAPKKTKKLFFVNLDNTKAENPHNKEQQSKPYNPKYWKLAGSSGDNILKNKAKRGIESV